jgi:hypothetical protein
MGLLNEGNSIEYTEKSCNYKVTLHRGYLCNKDRKYRIFTEFMRAARELKPGEQPSLLLFKINDTTYREVRDDKI